MSPIAVNFFRSVPTSIELNGPILSFTQQPVSTASTETGSITFTGIATASFPSQTPPNLASNAGELIYQWYEVGIGSIVGANTNTLTLSNLTNSSDNGRSFYLESTYISSRINSISSTRQRFTGNAINEPLNSNTVTVQVYPNIVINSQPTSSTAAVDNTTTFVVSASLEDGTTTGLTYQWRLNGNNLSNTQSGVSGANSPTLTISQASVGNNLVSVVISHPTAGNSPLVSTSVEYEVVEPRSIIKVEQYGSTSTAILTEYNLDESGFTLNPSELTEDKICLYASEKDIEIEMDVYGGPGSNSSTSSGGQGGYSKIRFSMQKNDEYIILGIKRNSAVFIYRKSNLIAVVGQGGSASSSGGSNGGAGGGVGLSGNNGLGRSGGVGGFLIGSGSLGLNGQFGSSASPSTIYPEDSIQTGRNGGITISCSKGIYWRDQGKTPCQDLGTGKFLLSNGTQITNSASISRGFKDGYLITQTAGLNVNTGGLGGNGATGGSGGAEFSGGGGGSGYTDGTIDVRESTIGGSTLARINVRISDGDFYIDSQGRILILSNTDNRDPRTLTKVTGKVLSGTNTCIDDARWQQFLNLARTTDGYRLTATLDGNTTRIVNATSNNIRRMLNGNTLTLRDSLTGWVDPNYSYTLLALAWDENNGPSFQGTGLDYSILSWSPTSSYGYGYYGLSGNSFFDPTTYNHFSANWWILPPGVPDF